MLGKVSLPGLRVFEAVARRGSFKAAAAELGLTPSAASHAVVNLETTLGVALFQRNGRHVRLTVSGELLVRHAAGAFDELRRGLDLVAAQKGRGLLRIHSAPSFAYAWLSPRLPKFLAAHAGIEVRLAAGADYARFTDDAFDVDIVYGPVHAAGVIAMPIVEETVTPLCAPALASRIRAPRDLLDCRLILSDNKQVRWPHWLEANGLAAAATHALRFDRSFLAIGAAADGLGVALESTLLARREIERGQLVAPLAGASVDIRYVGHHLVYPRETGRRSTVKAFVDWIEAEIAAG
ncbi:MAG: LysR family transcriptional regulator [Methylobacteriaceae bacterium]|nr:LysR family transcriptional regulator [Methylobacteriaceae bacterium]